MNKPELLTTSRKELDRIKVLELLIEKRIDQHRAAKMLTLSTRQMRRLQKLYSQDKASGIVSKRRGKPSNNRLSIEIRKKVCALIAERYQGFGPTLAAEKLLEQHQMKISTESIRQLMITHDLWHGRKRKTKKPVQQMRTRRPCFGELVQIDGSPHDWFEGRAEPCCLIVFIDDATSKLVSLLFVETECTAGYFTAVRQHLKHHGRPDAYYSDKHAIFRINTKEAASGTGFTQFGRACQELGIKLICAHTPQAKGRVERANATLQDRLVKELRLQNIRDIQTANTFLPEFIKTYNKRFSVTPAHSEDAHRKEIPDQASLDRILCHKATRKLSKQLELSYQNVLYQIQTNSPCYTMRHTHVTVCETPSGIVIMYKGKALPYKIFEKNNKPASVVASKEIDTLFKYKNKSHKPKANHPWRNRHKIAQVRHLPTGSTGLYARL